jgi:hypothetical protein
MQAFFSTLKTECFPDNQVFSSRAQARREIFEYIELYYNNQRLHSALGYQTPRQYETKFPTIIDIEADQAQGLDAAMEDRALLRTHLERRCSLANGRRGRLRAAHRPKGRHLPEQVQSEKSQGIRGTESPDSFDDTVKKTEHYVSVFSGELHFLTDKGQSARYDRAIYITTTIEQDQAMMQRANAIYNQDYNLGLNNCENLVNDALAAGEIATASGVSCASDYPSIYFPGQTMLSKVPNMAYDILTMYGTPDCA